VSWPYVVLGTGYACLAVGLLVTDALRQRELERALDQGRTRRSASGSSRYSPAAAWCWR
jgi:hypothetical protein